MVFPIHANYEQLTENREFKAFEDICKHYGLDKKLVISLDYLKKIGGSALTDNTLDVPRGGEGLEEGIPITYVPFRNGNLLAIAASYAEVVGTSFIYIGAVEEDSSGYPDCRLDFFKEYERAINLGTRPETKIEIKLPLIDMSKGEIVKLGKELDVPLKLSWSCYVGDEKACGVCDSCILRLKGFREAGFEDEIPYEMGEVKR
jgi:7-cyano-7-deazaguanine synthase